MFPYNNVLLKQEAIRDGFFEDIKEFPYNNVLLKRESKNYKYNKRGGHSPLLVSIQQCSS